MKRRLFLTGPMGFGKSTAIETALSGSLKYCGGFLTRRARNENGHPISFSLESPNGSEKEVFLDFSSGKAEIRMDVFATLGVTMLNGNVLVLDEIGGIELLCPEFMAALETVLHSDTPVIGVLKGEGPAGALIKALELTKEYELAAARLRQWMQADADTLLYECSKFDENALLLARRWVKEYAHE